MGVIVSEPDNAPLVDLLALLAYGQLEAFDRMSADARLAPDLRRRAALSEMAAAEIGTYRRLIRRLGQLSPDPYQAMAPFVEAIAAYHAETEPKDYLEALVKAYVGDGLSDDFYGEVAAMLAGDDRDLIMDVLHEGRYATFAADEIRAAIRADSKIANPLSMWARRLVGEGMSQALRVSAARPALVGQIVAREGEDGIDAMLRRITAAHTARMAAVGLNN
jgi:tRNA-(MS[2]IO[6]A)-hydroxylase MiaE-like protein